MAIVTAVTVTLIVILQLMSFGWFIVYLRHLIALIVYPWRSRHVIWC